jgi:hypothetical protein
MDVNILITCYNTEDHLPYLTRIISEFKLITPKICVVYSGQHKDSVPCDIYMENTNDLSRELAMILQGMAWFKNQKTTVSRYLKLSANVWPTNEDKIIKIFEEMDKIRRPYAGNIWHHNIEGSLSADFFLLNTDYGNIFKDVHAMINDTEVTIYRLLKEKNKNPYLIPEREPVFWNNYFECKKLDLLLYKKSEDNIRAFNEFKKKASIN